VLSGRGLCDGLITRSEESYRLWRVVVYDHETSQARRLKPARGVVAPGEKKEKKQLLVGLGLLIVEASRSHSDTPYWVGLLDE